MGLANVGIKVVRGNLLTWLYGAIFYEGAVMAKKYHHSMARRHHKYDGPQGEYAGMEHRDMQEREDGMMLREDHNAIANMPQHVMIKPYPKCGYGLPEDLDDTMRGVDAQIDLDTQKRMQSFRPKKIG